VGAYSLAMRSRRLLSSFASYVLVCGAAACSSSSPTQSTPDAKTSDDGGHTPPRADAGKDATVPHDAAHDVTLDYQVTAYDGIAPDAAVARVPVNAELVSNRVQVDHMLFAAGEMQTSGEPFASGFAGRNLGDYDRNWLPPNQYILNLGTVNVDPILDLFGFSTAVESYEYSKMHMNMVIQESAAGVSLANGPVVAGEPGATALAKLQARMADILTSAGTAAAKFATLPAPSGNNQNYLGWPGQWPSFAPFSDWDPTMDASMAVTTSCSFSGGYKSISIGTTSPVYECNYNTTHLVDPIGQVNRVLTPTTLGYAAWKQALWAIDFAGRIHDLAGNQVNSLLPGDLALVGTAGNTVTGTSPDGAAVGTYIGSSPVEGMWGLTMLTTMDNAAEWMRSALLTADGATLSGMTGAAAMQYDYASPLTWFPASIAVTEDDTQQPFPPVTGMAITDGTSSSEGLAALLLGHAMLFGMTDPRNAGVGQRIGLQATFDGDPFPSNVGLAVGQATTHDRALGIIRLAFVDLDRIHADPTLGVFADTATVTGTGAGQAITRGTTVTTSNLAHVLIGLRQTLLSVNGSITQYGAADPDPNVDVNCIFVQDDLPIHPTAGVEAGASPSFSQRVRSVFTTNANFVMSTLTQPDGSVVNGVTLAGGVATPLTTPATLQSQTSALRALIEAFLLTGDATFQTRAQAVARHLIGPAFYSASARMYRGTEGGSDEVDMTPELFGFLQSGLRETYKALYVAGDPALDRNVLGDRIQRVNKLFLNGWDDLNGNGTLTVDGGDYPSECILSVAGLVNGGLQQAEQALTGEIGIDLEGKHVRDRDEDCVPELAHAGHASTLAADIHFHSP
jgi:hypothetical protein